ncbi:MAG: M28 family peptidase [Saprospiraceae bacterium]
MKQFIFICLLFATFQSINGQNLAPVISGFNVSVDAPNSSASLFYILNDAENDPLEVIVQFSKDGGKTYTTLESPDISGDIGFPVSSGIRTATCQNLDFSQPLKYVFRLIAYDLQTFDIQALVDQVDSTRLRNDLTFIEGIRHNSTGLNHLNETRDSISRLFNNQNLHFENQSFPIGNLIGQNLIGTNPGTDSADQVVIVDAHYDTVANAPGADDNGSGTVGVMEIARLLSQYPSKKTQRYIGFDLEELGRLGSINYVNNGIPASESIKGVFNFEMIGYWSDQPNSQSLPTGFGLLFPLQTQEVANNQYRGDFITNVGNDASNSLGLLFSQATQQYVPGLKVISLAVPGNGSLAPDLRRSDHASFWDGNHQALMLTDGANFRNECYHTPSDTLDEKLNFTFMSNVVKATLAAMAELVEIQHGDWATTAYDLSSGTQEPFPCSFHWLPGNRLMLQGEGCLEGEYTIELYDMSGKQFMSRNSNLNIGVNNAIDLPSLPAGIYLAKLGGENTFYTQKIQIH